jgi:nitrogenase subunit NifH
VIDANRAIKLQKKTGTSDDSLIEEINTKISSFAKRKNQMRQAKSQQMALNQIAPTQNIWSAYWSAKDCP